MSILLAGFFPGIIRGLESFRFQRLSRSSRRRQVSIGQWVFWLPSHQTHLRQTSQQSRGQGQNWHDHLHQNHQDWLVALNSSHELRKFQGVEIFVTYRIWGFFPECMRNNHYFPSRLDHSSGMTGLLCMWLVLVLTVINEKNDLSSFSFAFSAES